MADLFCNSATHNHKGFFHSSSCTRLVLHPEFESLLDHNTAFVLISHINVNIYLKYSKHKVFLVICLKCKNIVFIQGYPDDTRIISFLINNFSITFPLSQQTKSSIVLVTKQELKPHFSYFSTPRVKLVLCVLLFWQKDTCFQVQKQTHMEERPFAIQGTVSKSLNEIVQLSAHILHMFLRFSGLSFKSVPWYRTKRDLLS